MAKPKKPEITFNAKTMEMEEEPNKFDVAAESAKAENVKVAIKPTIGRMLYYNDGSSDQRCAAQIAYVHDDGCINISYADQFGNSMTALKVTLIHDGECATGECEWMPYQVGQAKK